MDFPQFKALRPIIDNHKFERMLIEGEHQQQDFKFRIDDSRKIAKSLVAFANTDGGRLLVGVKDNGSVAGVRSDEEFYMVEAAAQLYTKPEVHIEPRLWEVDGKRVLEVLVEPSKDRPHRALDEDGRWLTYIRKDDQNLLANRVLLGVWTKQSSTKGLKVAYTDIEDKLLTYLRENESITISKFRRMANISIRKAEQVLIRLICWEIIDIDIQQTGTVYRLRPQIKVPELKAG